MGKRNGIGTIGAMPLQPSSKSKITEEYVLQSAINNEENAKLAVGLSTNEILLFDLQSTAKILSCKGHENSVTGMKFSHENPSIVFTSSLDGNIFAWDIRQGIKPAQTYFDNTDGPLKGLLCFDYNVNERYICAGTELIREDSFLIFWDQRSSKNLGGYWNSHTEEVTHVQFHLKCESSLASSSTDGLINIFDLTQCTEDDAITNTLNIETSINRFFWDPSDLVSCISGIEDYQLWSAEETKPTLTLNRADLSKKYECPVDYFIDTFGVNDSVYLASGSNEGNVHLYSQNEKDLKLIATLERGHCDVVRTLSLSKGNCLVTGSEDGYLCTWIPLYD